MEKKVLTTSNIKLLEKIGFAPKRQEEQAISELVLFILFSVLLSCFMGYQLGSNSNISKGWEVLISLMIVIVGYDMVKEFIGNTVKAVSNEKFQAGRIEGSKELEKHLENTRADYSSNIEKIRRHYETQIDNSVQKQKHLYYISQITNGSSAFSISDLKLNELNEDLCKEIDCLGANSFQEKLGEKFEEIKRNRAIRCLIHELPDRDFIQPMALLAAMYSLNKNKEEMNVLPEYYFFRDIYAYLKGWLICSIDNDDGTLMPISLIGLNYPDSENPNRNLYETALIHIRDELLEKNDSKKALSEPAIKLIKNYLDKLLELIKDYQTSTS